MGSFGGVPNCLIRLKVSQPYALRSLCGEALVCPPIT